MLLHDEMLTSVESRVPTKGKQGVIRDTILYTARATHTDTRNEPHIYSDSICLYRRHGVSAGYDRWLWT